MKRSRTLASMNFRRSKNMKINNTKELKQALRDGPYAWPGGYPLYFIAADGEPLCHKCVRGNFKQVIYETYRPRAGDMFRVIGQEINYEDEHLHCAHCEEQIQSAYGEQQ